MKALLILPVVWIVLSVFNDVSFGDSTILGIALLIISYLAGDMMILPKMGNMSATIGDLLVGTLVLWGGLNLLGYTEALGEAFLSAAIICVGEYFLHSWILKTQFSNKYV
ncbi:YndM family protein [Sporosarcina sp. ACRSL]|nr:YndM family protein [Sporosarcina sp. ACRSL]